jgi:hypothetical protein
MNHNPLSPNTPDRTEGLEITSKLEPALEAAGVQQAVTVASTQPLNYDKPRVLQYIRELVENFSNKRIQGEAVGVGATAIQGTTLTAAGVVAGVTASGVTVAGAALAFPLTAAIAAVAVITGLILRQTALNEELRVNLIMIKGEVERIYNIYKVIEDIAIEKKLAINTDMVRKFTIILSNNILIVAGPETFEMIRTMSLGNGEAFFQSEKFGPLPALNKSQIITQRKKWWTISFFKRTIVPMEVLRTIVRDITILTVFFTILQSEFDLLSREKEEKDRIALFDAIFSDSGIQFQPDTVKAFQNYSGSNQWMNGVAFKTFKAQLPKNNLNIAINDSEQGIKNHGTDPTLPSALSVNTMKPSPPSSNPASPPRSPTGGKRTRRRTHMKKRQSKRKTRSRK